MEGKTFLIIGIVVVFILLITSGIYFIAKPVFEKYIESKRIEAKDITLGIILQQVQQQGYTIITDVKGTQLILVPLSKEKLNDLKQNNDYSDI